MTPTLLINAVDRTDFLAVSTCRIRRQLNGRSEASMTLEERNLGYRPIVGQPVLVELGDRKFAGQIDALTEGIHAGPSNARQFSVKCVDYNQICDRRLVTWRYPGAAALTLKQIVEHIVGAFLDGEGITTTGVATGPAITEDLAFNYATATEVFNKLAAITGYAWYINFLKDLQFSQFTSIPAPISITDSSGNWRDLRVVRDRSQYRNRQYVRTEFEVAATRTESFTGNGSQIVFPTQHNISATPAVAVNSVPKTIGELGVDHLGKQFYWVRDGRGIFNQDHPVLSGSDTLGVIYQSQYTNVGLSEDAAEIAARAAAEGGSGKYEAIREERNISSLNALEAIAFGELQANGFIVTSVELEADEPSLAPGQKLPITLTQYDINDEFLIESVDVQWMAAQQDFLRTKVKCSDRTIVVQAPRPAQMLQRLAEVVRIGSDPKQTVSSTEIPGLEPAPGNVSSIVGTHRYRALNTSTPILELGFTYTPPSEPNFEGVNPAVEDPDQSANAGFVPMDATIPMDGTYNMYGDWRPIRHGLKPYQAGEQLWIEAPVRNTARNIRVYLPSNANELIRAGQAGATPNVVITVPPPSYAPSGEEFCAAIPQADYSVVKVREYDAGGKNYTVLAINFLRPVLRPPSGLHVYIEWSGQALKFLGVVVASGQEVEVDTPAEVVTASVWGRSFIDSHDTPDPSDDAVNTIVGGVTPRATVVIGTTAGVIDPTVLVQAKLDSTDFQIAAGLLAIKNLNLGKALGSSFNNAELRLVGGKLEINGLDLTKVIADTISSELRVAGGKFEIDHIGAAKVTAGTLAAGVAYVGDLIANQLVSGTIAANIAYLGTLAASQVTAGTFVAGVVYAGAVAVSQLTAGTVNVAITMTAPTLVITSGSVTVNIDNSNFVKVTDSSQTRHSQITGTQFRVQHSSDSNRFTALQLHLLTMSGPSGTNRVDLSETSMNFNLTQVVTSRRTGWGAPTGTANRSTFDPATIPNLESLAQRVKALIDDLMTHGLIGA